MENEGQPRDQRTIAALSFVGRSRGAVKTLGGFKKGHHTVPDAATPTTQAFLGKLCAGELTEEAEALFQSVRAALDYKRRDLSLSLASPSAVLTAKDFVVETHYALDPADPAYYLVTHTLHGVRSPLLLETAEFDALFAGRFTELSFALRRGARVESVIDAIENLPADTAAADRGLTVEYPSDCRECTIRVPCVDATVRFTGATLDLIVPHPSSPRALLEHFLAVRHAFSLADETLSALVG